MSAAQADLASHPFISGLSDAHVSLLMACASEARFVQDEFIFRAMSAANRFYLLCEGKVSLRLHLGSEAAPVVVQTIVGGHALGWSWLTPPYRWQFDAVAVTAVRAFALEAERLRRTLDENPVLGYEVTKRIIPVLAERLQGTRLQLMDVFGSKNR